MFIIFLYSREIDFRTILLHAWKETFERIDAQIVQTTTK